MASLFFPQFSTGAIAQYPLRRGHLARSVKNVLPSGELILLPDPGATKLVWQLAYSALNAADLQQLQTLFQECQGPVHAFTFIDPVDNMLSGSATLSSAFWTIPSGITVSSAMPDPMGGSGALVLTNTGQSAQAITQTLAVPAWYQYCFSVYAMSNQPSTLTLTRQGASSAAETACTIGSNWTRAVSAGVLGDTAATFTAGLQLAAGQQVTVFGPQLEPQTAPSRYWPTLQKGGVYAAAHWSVNELLIAAQGPNLFATNFSIEAAIQD
ncbi:MAG: hypothetical protein JO270_05070 [Acidobacteriaceae bacterium]|nr:hypothetical protein [Acidobacteriaceae bacterium]